MKETRLINHTAHRRRATEGGEAPGRRLPLIVERYLSVCRGTFDPQLRDTLGYAAFDVDPVY